ncbi:hypothetical protein V5799_013124 [Amblyomma americanum]|uniref:VWFA domain-containing protein n=1 Tax=Amblyomma americanum TaxID=6943 RepID=A0AAQ4E6S4_AMBAM
MRLLLALCLLLLAVPEGGKCLRLTPDLQTFVSTLEQYANEKNDIVFVLDESGSIGAENFPAELTFTEVMSRLLVVSKDYSRLTVITFASDNHKHIDQIADGGTMCGFVEQVNNIPYRMGGTATRQALQYASELLKKARPDANRIIVLISDGQANSGSEPNYIASVLKSQGIIIFAVGVASINRAELEAVATSQQHIYMLRDFAYIKQVNSDLRNGCPLGTYKDVASDLNCKPCPANSVTDREGATSEAQCSCEPGYEGDPGNKKPCSREYP